MNTTKTKQGNSNNSYTRNSNNQHTTTKHIQIKNKNKCSTQSSTKPQELFPPTPKPTWKPLWIKHETRELIQQHQAQGHLTRQTGNQPGIPRWEQAFKQLDQTKQRAPSNQQNKIEKEFIHQQTEEFNVSAEDIINTRKQWNSWRELRKNNDSCATIYKK